MPPKGVKADYEQEAWYMYHRNLGRVRELMPDEPMAVRHAMAAQMTVAAMLGRIAKLLEKKS